MAYANPLSAKILRLEERKTNFLDDEFSWADHIEYIRTKLAKCLGTICKAKKTSWIPQHCITTPIILIWIIVFKYWVTPVKFMCKLQQVCNEMLWGSVLTSWNACVDQLFKNTKRRCLFIKSVSYGVAIANSVADLCCESVIAVYNIL